MIEFLLSNWFLLLVLIFYGFAIFIFIGILLENRSPAKTLAYLFAILFLPIAGILIYFIVGINYRKKKAYNKKLWIDKRFFETAMADIIKNSEEEIKSHATLLEDKEKLIRLLLTDSLRPITSGNKVKILRNGEEKFIEVLHELKKATKFIHIEYFIIEDDNIGKAIKAILLDKVKAGVKVRLIYDDFGSRHIRKTLVRELRAGGVKIFPFFEIKFPLLANRINYRDHRKIIIVDGLIGFVGGINISDKYDNRVKSNKIYWRDTHLKIEGNAVHTLQYMFISNWNFCSDESLPLSNELLPPANFDKDLLVQIAGSGPDSQRATLMLAYLAAIYGANKEICLTTPYFIPNEPIYDAIRNAALGGVRVRMLVPGISDTLFVKAAARSYYQGLLEIGVEIYQYQKGFVHAKTLTIDDNLSIVGTANMDIRSFDLNFEVNAFIYDKKITNELKAQFEEDVLNSKLINAERWKKRSKIKTISESLSRLLSPIL